MYKQSSGLKDLIEIILVDLSDIRLSNFLHFILL
jgi:hypothetical protein